MPPRRGRSKRDAGLDNVSIHEGDKGEATPVQAHSPPPKRPKHATPRAVKEDDAALKSPATPTPAIIKSNDRHVLVSLGPLTRGILVKRPSAAIRTPYVADVRLAGSASDDEPLILAHAPSMDCAGMVMPGASVYMTRNVPKQAGSQGGATKTSHAIQVVEDVRDADGRTALVGYHPMLAERVAREAVQRGLLAASLGPHTRLESQKTFGDTRVDYVLTHADGSRTLLEVKNVVCADFQEEHVPPGRPKVGVYTSPQPSDGSPWQPTALFPHGSHKPGIKVVSDRAIKHVHELTGLHSGDTRAAILFVVNRGDCAAFRPCDEADALFANVLKRARDTGVMLLAHDVQLDPVSGEVVWGKPLPVVFRDTVTGDVDADHLQQVLRFNQTDPRKNWKAAKKGATAAAAAAGVVTGQRGAGAVQKGRMRKRRKPQSESEEESSVSTQETEEESEGSPSSSSS